MKFHKMILNDSKVMVGCILWHIKSCTLFKAKSFLYIYINYVWFANELFIGNILNNLKLICLHTVKWLSSSIWPIHGIWTGTTT